MTNRNLTPEQINDLFSFCEEQDVFHYDLQLELVDHLAAAIEQKWTENPKLTYDKALWAVFDQFGISGFRKIRKAKEKELRKKYSRVLWQYIGEFFKLPKIILTIIIILFLFGIFRRSENNLDTFLLLLFPYLIFLAVIQFMNKKKYQISLVPGKSFLLNDHLKRIKSRFDVSFQLPTFVLIFYVEYLQRTNTYQAHNAYIELLIAFLVAFFSIFLVAMSIYVPKRIKEDFTYDFPQFVKS
jgi:hypothetical protein